MKIGIVGFGKMGMLHGALLNALEDVTIEAITDTSKLVLKGFKSVFPKVKCYTSYEKMIDECNLDAVIIATPSFSHVAIAKYAINRNINIFVEKPLSNNLQNSIELDELAKTNNVISMIGFCMRYNPMFVKGKEIIDSNLLGSITEVSSFMYCSDILSEQNGWRFNPSISGGGVLIDFAIHMVDMLYYYFGEVEYVSGAIKSIYSTSVEDEVSATLSFKNGVKADLHSSWSNPDYRKPYYKLIVAGANGKMTITDQELIVEQHEKETTKLYYPDLYKGVHIDIGGPHFSLQMKYFAESIQQKRNPTADISTGLYVQKLIDSIYNSSINKENIKISEDNNNEY